MRSTQFALEWSMVTSERAESQTFWNEFFEIFKVPRKRLAVYEKQVAKLGTGKAKGRIDLFWPGTLLVEHKSLGANLDAAFTQALDYFAGLNDVETPRYVVVSDFQRFRLYDLEDGGETEFRLADLPAHIHLFGFIAGFQKLRIREEPEANITAVQRLGELHDALKQDGYQGHELEVFLVRLLFCLFADDTGLFSPKDSFLALLESIRDDGHDTGSLLARLFQALDTPRDTRQKSQQELFAPFPHVNGQLFLENLHIPEFNAIMHRLLIECCKLNWGNISPAIFGAMFQKIIELDARDRRRQLGAHYTSEANILKLIGPLFLDELRNEFERVQHNKNQLFDFHKKLARLNFLDPACGCGNFLVITYRELRKLELDILRAARAFGHAIGRVFDALQVNVDQFHGIEIEEFPAQIAQVAMWLTDHQMNVEAGREYGEFFARIPLLKSANIRLGNALRLDWEAFVPPIRLNYILGNPPFIGAKMMNEIQRKDFAIATNNLKGIGVLDYVCGWYFKAAQYLSGSKEGFASSDKKQFADVRFSDGADTLDVGWVSPQGRNSPPQVASIAKGGLRGKTAANPPYASPIGNVGVNRIPAIEDLFVTFERQDNAAREKIRCAFVSTNSISQGEQVGVLWSQLFRHGVKIQFAHRTFKWSNEAPGKAAVHCVIIGFGREQLKHERLFDYAAIDGLPSERVVANINPYLVDGPDVLIGRRDTPLSPVPGIGIGNKPIDGGHYLFTTEERDVFITKEPLSAKWFRRWLGADEFLNGYERWCLWLGDCPPQELKNMPEALKRVQAVKAVRLASKSAPTRKIADTPTRFHVENIPDKTFLLIPGVSSERRSFVPIGFVTPDVLASNLTLIARNVSLWHFGILSSTMHMAWVRYVCGRLESRYRYSAQIVYNNFPWPEIIAASAGRDPASNPAAAKPVTTTPAQEALLRIENAAQTVLDARAAHPSATLAQLYDPLSMPPNLVKAHQQLDRAVDAAYVADGGSKHYADDAGRVAFLFRRYAMLSGILG